MSVCVYVPSLQTYTSFLATALHLHFMAPVSICPGGRIQNLSPYPYRTIDIDMKKDLVKILEGDQSIIIPEKWGHLQTSVA